MVKEEMLRKPVCPPRMGGLAQEVAVGLPGVAGVFRVGTPARRSEPALEAWGVRSADDPRDSAAGASSAGVGPPETVAHPADGRKDWAVGGPRHAGPNAVQEGVPAAAHLGLCSMGTKDEAWSTAAVEALTQACLPVLVFVKSDQIHWPHNGGWYQNSEHIMLVSGFSGSGSAKVAHVSDPLDYSGHCRPNEQDPDAICGGPYTVPYADLDKALRLSSRGWWGKAYGERLGNCDLGPRCGGGGGSGGGGSVEDREPYRHIALRMASACREPKVWIAYDTTTTPAEGPVAPYVKTFSIINDGFFRTYDFRMDGTRTSQYFKGTLKALRIQPSETPGCDVAFSYLALHDGDGDIARQWHFAQGKGGWWAANMIDRDLPGSWQLTTRSAAPFIQRDGLNIDLRR